MMLSRTADHLYWMSRYTERAENLARMLEVNTRMGLLLRQDEQLDLAWAATLAMIGQLEGYRARHAMVSADRVIAYLAFDAGNPGSIVSHLHSARENARAVRGTLTSEQWETINSTWLELGGLRREGLSTDELIDFFEWVKFRSHLLRGVTQGTMLRDEGFDFTRIGTFLERADSTARILDVQLRLLAPEGLEAAGNVDYYKYSALLASVSAFEIYRKVYRDRITPDRVAELLILRADMPRSLHRCVNELTTHLAAVANDQSGETIRRAGELHALLLYGRIDLILEEGLHEFLANFLIRIRDLGRRIGQDFLVSSAG
jgi:uncharacterized alpha-E superfamily protein